MTFARTTPATTSRPLPKTDRRQTVATRHPHQHRSPVRQPFDVRQRDRRATSHRLRDWPRHQPHSVHTRQPMWKEVPRLWHPTNCSPEWRPRSFANRDRRSVRWLPCPFAAAKPIRRSCLPCRNRRNSKRHQFRNRPTSRHRRLKFLKPSFHPFGKSELEIERDEFDLSPAHHPGDSEVSVVHVARTFECCIVCRSPAGNTSVA